MKLNWKTMGAMEKNSLIAEHVMGWGNPTKSEIRGHGHHPNDPVFWSEEGLTYFSPATNPADCALVKERFQMWRVNRWSETLYEAQIGEFTAEARTECEAFCLAALRASGIEVEV